MINTNNNYYTQEEIDNILLNFERIIITKDRVLSAAELYTDMINLIKLLPDIQKKLIYYRYCLGYNTEETANKLNISIGRVSTMLKKAKKNLHLLSKKGSTLNTKKLKYNLR